jgi:ribosomal protein L4
VLDRAARNLAGLRLVRARDLTSYTALLAEQLVFTKAALDQITARLDGSTPGVN